MHNPALEHIAADRIRRKSVFREVGLTEDDATTYPCTTERPLRKLRFNSTPDVFEYDSSELSDFNERSPDDTKDLQEKIPHTRTIVLSPKTTLNDFHGSSVMYRLSALGLILAICVPLLQGAPWFGQASVPLNGVTGGVIRKDYNPILDGQPGSLVRRDATDVCERFSHQSALVNGTLYIYGGQATTSIGQIENTWNNNFLSMDLTTSWQISTPTLKELPQPSGPPNVSNAYLWNSYDSLYLYGGEFSWKPAVSPSANSMWEYNIKTSQWYEHQSPTTSSGNNSVADGQAVQRAAEGAGANVPSLGRGYYFGGHEDGYTTEGWSQSVPRIYLQSLLEFTFPGSTNNQVNTLSNGKTAGTDGNWRNITEGGSQGTAGFPERADGTLLYVPGFGAEGILLGLAGGANSTLQQMNIIDVFDIATSTWYKQAASGPTPKYRVNPCAVVAAAPDGSSYNVFMYGGQDLAPDGGSQTQYSDTWILTIPSFTWIQVDTTNQAVPEGRAGHSCNIWDGQMIVVGGYVGANTSCDSPGIYVFNLSTLKWAEQFTALSGGSTSGSNAGSSASASSGAASATSTSSGSSAPFSSFVSNSKTNPLNQQPAQLLNSTSPGGLEGSYGYEVAPAIISVIGGASTGGATITKPAQTATAGPLKTGTPVTYTVTGANGAVTTETGAAGSNPGNGSGSGGSGPNIAAIVAGTIAGVLFILVCYLFFCAWLYRKQLRLYKRHVEMTQQFDRGEKDPLAAPAFFGETSSKNSSDRRRADESKLSSEASASGTAGGSSGQNNNVANSGYNSLRRSSSGGASEYDLMNGHEPTFWGTMLAPRKSLRVVNRD